MKNLIILLSSLTLLFITGCSSTCMEYRSATTAARSEKNMKRAEEWGLIALESPACNPSSDALVPYFLATEVYLIQKNYGKMAEMLNIAERRNPNQPLENPFKLGDTPIKTIGEGVEAYREQEWVTVYNKAVDLIQKKKVERAQKLIEIAILINPKKAENYITLSAMHLQNEKIKTAISTIDRGLEVDNGNSLLNQMKADISVENNELETARTLYLQAIESSDDPGPIKIKLLNIYIELGENELAIDFSDELLYQYPDDPNIYYNVGVVYQRLSTEIYDGNLIQFNTIGDLTPEEILNLYKSYKRAREYAYNARDNFLQTSDLEMDENNSTLEAAKDMKKLMKKIDEMFIPSIRKRAQLAGIELE